MDRGLAVESRVSQVCVYTHTHEYVPFSVSHQEPADHVVFSIDASKVTNRPAIHLSRGDRVVLVRAHGLNYLKVTRKKAGHKIFIPRALI
jgi:hypothetical protein